MKKLVLFSLLITYSLHLHAGSFSPAELLQSIGYYPRKYVSATLAFLKYTLWSTPRQSAYQRTNTCVEELKCPLAENYKKRVAVLTGAEHYQKSEEDCEEKKDTPCGGLLRGLVTKSIAGKFTYGLFFKKDTFKVECYSRFNFNSQDTLPIPCIKVTDTSNGEHLVYTYTHNEWEREVSKNFFNTLQDISKK